MNAVAIQKGPEQWAIDIGGMEILSTSGKHFASKEKAESFMRCAKYKIHDSRFNGVTVPNKPNAKTEAPASAPFTNVQGFAANSNAQGFTPVPKANCTAVLDMIGRSPNETFKPKAMSVEDFMQVHSAYEKIVANFTQDQLNCLSGLLYRYDQAWTLYNQIEKVKIQNAGHDYRTAWKREKTPIVVTDSIEADFEE